MSNFLIKPNSIKKSDVFNKVFSLHPTEHIKIDIVNTNLKSISQLIIEEGVGEQIDVGEYLNFDSNYTLVTISNMGKCIVNENQGERVSPNIFNKSSKKLQKGDVLISRNASLGKISLVNRDFKGILNGGISYLRLKEKSKFYAFAFFLLDYGKDYLTVLTSGGGTQKNAKRQNLLDLRIPFPTSENHKKPESVQQYISLLTQNLINKEEQIEVKQKEIDNAVYSELRSNQKKEFKYSLPRKSDLLKMSRLDTGLFTRKYKTENHLIENYKKGYSKINSSKLRSGSTPRTRIFNASNSILKWVTPTNITDEGFYNPIEKISMPTDNNIRKNCILFINRTSKGKKGEYVGITCFYDIDYYGAGHHNQGLYRIEHLTKNEMLFITAFMNSRIVRKICGNVSIGSKMKEMKSYDFAALKFPDFDNNLKQKIGNIYYNNIDRIEFDFNLYLENEKIRNASLGIFQLNSEIIEIKNELETLINQIIKNEQIKMNF